MNLLSKLKKWVNEPHRVKIEVMPAILTIAYVILFYYLLISNKNNWEFINDFISSTIGLKTNYIYLLFGVLGSFGLYSIIVILYGFKSSLFKHRGIHLILSSVLVIFLVVLLYVIMNVNARIQLDFIYFNIGENSIYFYLGVGSVLFLVIGVFILSIWSLYQKGCEKTQSIAEDKPMAMQHAAILTGIACLIGFVPFFNVLFVFATTYVYWTNFFSIFIRYSESGFIYLTLIGVLLIVYPFLLVLFKSKSKGNLKIVLWILYLCVSSLSFIFGIIAMWIMINNLGPNPPFSLWYPIKLLIILWGAVSSLNFALTYRIIKKTSISKEFKAQITSKEGVPRNSEPQHGKSSNCDQKVKAILILSVIFIGLALFYDAPLIDQTPNVDLQMMTRLELVDGHLVPFQGNIMYPTFESQPTFTEGGYRNYLNLSGPWRFSLGSGTTETDLSFSIRTDKIINKIGGNHIALAYDDSNWDMLNVPSSFNQHDGLKSEWFNYQGVVWYRRWINTSIVSNVANQKFILKFLGSNYITDVWVDEHYIGYHEGGFTAFAFEISEIIQTHTNLTQHLIAIRVDTVGFNSKYYSKMIPGGADWFNYGGIVREIYLEIAPITHISRVDVKPTKFYLTEGNAYNGSVDVEILVSGQVPENLSQSEVLQITVGLHALNFTNNTALFDTKIWKYTSETPTPIITGSSIINRSKSNLGSSGYFASLFTWHVDNLLFWTPKQPAVYGVEVNISSNEGMDRFFTQTGFRNFCVNGTKILLNGVPWYLVGNSLHEEYPGMGRSLTDERIATDLQLLKYNLSCNFFRTSYPTDPYYTIISDRLGLGYWEELPVFWFNEINFIQANVRNSLNSTFIEMVYRDFNRPSIIFWGACNEPWAETKLYPYLQELRKFQESIDPNRILAFASASSQTWTRGHQYLRMVTPNTYWGTFDGKRGEYYEGTKGALELFVRYNPNKPILSLEFGMWGDQEQLRAFNNYTRAFLENPAVVGFTHWCAFDYWGPDYYNGMGVYNMERNWSRPIQPVMQSLYVNLTNNGP